jgi:hypothetical protein
MIFKSIAGKKFVRGRRIVHGRKDAVPWKFYQKCSQPQLTHPMHNRCSYLVLEYTAWVIDLERS